MTWQHSAPSNQTNLTHQHNTSQVKDSLSDPPKFLVEETLEFQVEYPQEVEEEVEVEVEVKEAEEEVSLLQYWHNKQPPMQETNLSAIRHLPSQEIVQNRRRL